VTRKIKEGKQKEENKIHILSKGKTEKKRKQNRKKKRKYKERKTERRKESTDFKLWLDNNKR
jgi:hypothetical protein